MIGLHLRPEGPPLRILAVGAHADDIEIGAGGAVLSLMASAQPVEAVWCVVSAVGERKAEAQAGADFFLDGAASAQVETGPFRDGYLPYEAASVKDWLRALRERTPAPDLILTHTAQDAHQDHRLIHEMVWTTWRDALILEFEIPKWDGDLGRPNLYAPLTASQLARKIEGLERAFASQRGKDWFDAETFRGLARIRGMECRAPERFAEAFVCRKGVLSF